MTLGHIDWAYLHISHSPGTIEGWSKVSPQSQDLRIILISLLLQEGSDIRV